MIPLYYDENGTPVFNTDQIDMYGYPPFDTYIVVQAQPHYYASYAQTLSIPIKKKRSVHYYSRYERFRLTLNQLSGIELNVGEKVIQSRQWQTCINEMKQTRFSTNEACWVFARRILKKYRFSKYYNRIPALLQEIDYELTGYKPAQITKQQYDAIMRDFGLLNTYFSNYTDERKYFFNMRFVVLTLMKKHNVVNTYRIPLLITKQKRIELKNEYDRLWEFILHAHVSS